MNTTCNWQHPVVKLAESRPVQIALLLLAIGFCYFPGLDSLFLFDDGPNLDALQHIQDAPMTSPGFWEFVFGGQAGPTGRPVSLFTFALQAASWPDQPAAFKLVNLLIHGFSALLVYTISFRLALHLQAPARQASLVALTTALVWALHPVHTSTVLYAVQRMALLSNLFMLLGVYCYLVFRLREPGNSRGQLATLTVALGTTGLLALFSKENAPSLVFYLLALEYTLLRDCPASRDFQRWRAVCLWLPAILVLLLPVVFLEQLQAGYADNYDYTMIARLMTQARVLWDYLAVLLLPSTAAVGIFHDITVSTSLFNPLTTLIAIAAWFLLTGLVIARPGRHRIWLFALAWFLAGHLIESTVLSLELFFHHRNYLAFLGIVFALVHGFYNWLPETLLRQRARLAIAGVYLLLLALNTARISSLWAQPLQLAERWYDAEPETARNVEFYAMQLTQYGREGELLAAAVLNRAVNNDEGDFHVLLNLVTLACVNPAVTPPEETRLLRAARNMPAGNRDPVSPMRQIVNLHLQGNCPAYSAMFLEDLLATLSENTTDFDKGTFQFEQFRLLQAQGQNTRALDLLEAAYANSGDAGILFNHAIVLVNSGRYNEALEKIDLAIREISTSNNIRTGTRASKLASLNSMREDVLGFIAQSQ